MGLNGEKLSALFCVMQLWISIEISTTGALKSTGAVKLLNHTTSNTITATTQWFWII